MKFRYILSPVSGDKAGDAHRILIYITDQLLWRWNRGTGMLGQVELVTDTVHTTILLNTGTLDILKELPPCLQPWEDASEDTPVLLPEDFDIPVYEVETNRDNDGGSQYMVREESVRLRISETATMFTFYYKNDDSIMSSFDLARPLREILGKTPTLSLELLRRLLDSPELNAFAVSEDTLRLLGLVKAEMNLTW